VCELYNEGFASVSSYSVKVLVTACKKTNYGITNSGSSQCIIRYSEFIEICIYIQDKTGANCL
jgi:hypothetical protein